MPYLYHQSQNIYNGVLSNQLKVQTSEIHYNRERLNVIFTENEYKELTDGSKTFYAAYSDLVQTVDSLSVAFSSFQTTTGTNFSEVNSKIANYKASVDGLSADLSNYKEIVADNYATKIYLENSLEATAEGVELKISKKQFEGFAVEYAVSTESTPPQNGWSIKVPEWTTDKNIWRRTVAYKSDGTINSGTPTLIQTADGMQVVSTVIEYYLSDSDTTLTGGSWSTTPQDYVNGKYYWIRDKFTYTSGAYDYSVPTLESVLSGINVWRTTAERKTTADAIVSTVTRSSQFGTSVGSIIEQNADSIRLKADAISWTSTYSELTENGELYVTSGEIGGFEIDTTSIHTIDVPVASNADNSIALSSADFTRTINNVSRAGLRLAIGDKFGVTGDGVIYASDVDLSGTINATGGSIGGFEIDTTSIHTIDVPVASNADNSIALSSANFTRTIGGASTSGLKFAIGGNFGITYNGTMHANQAVLSNITADSGTISNITATNLTANTGTIAGFDIGNGYIKYGKSSLSDNVNGVYIATNGIALGSHFKVDNAGNITSTGGSIAGFTIGEDAIQYGSFFMAHDYIELGQFRVNTSGNLQTRGFTISGSEIMDRATDGESLSISPSSIVIGDVGLYSGGTIRCTTLGDIVHKVTTIYTTDMNVYNTLKLPGAAILFSGGDPLVIDPTDSSVCRITSSSSIRYKEKLRDMTTDDIENAYNIQPVMARYKKEIISEKDERYMHYFPMFIAEDVEKYMPDVVDHKGELPESWNTRVMVPVMFQMIKSQKEEITKLKETLSKWQNITA